MLILCNLLQEDGVSLKESSGGRFVALCPFHKEDTPSLTIYPTDTYSCFGCHAWGDPIKWLVEYRKMPAKQALEYFGVEYQRRRTPSVIKIRNTAKAYPFLAEVAEAYHQFLFKQKGAVDYLLSRGLTMDSVEKYKVGYTDGRVLNFKFVSDYELGQLTGVLEESGYERLTHRITIPNLINSKYADFMSGRTVINDKKKYLNISVPKPIQGFWEVRNEPVLYLVEGLFDWLLLRQWGFAAIALAGSSLTKLNAMLLRDKKVVIIPDNDAVGRTAGQAILAKLTNSEILDYTSLGAKDIGEVALLPDGENKFKELIRGINV